MNSRIRKSVLCVVALASFFLPTGCGLQQNQYAQLAGDIGTQVSSIVALTGDTATATKITQDTAAAVAAIKSFKKGTPVENTVQVINILIADLNLIPAVGPYGPLIDLALGTIEYVINDLTQHDTATPASGVASPQATARATVTKPRAVYLTNTPKNRSEFRKQWNAIVDANSTISKSVKF
jgi:hypothetical protein